MTTMQQILASGFRSIADAIDGGDTAQPAALDAEAGPTVLGLTALVQVIRPVLRIVDGQGSLEDDAKLANLVMDAIAYEFPQTAGAISAVELAEPVFFWLVGAIKGGQITGGVPAAFPPGGGPGPYRSR